MGIVRVFIAYSLGSLVACEALCSEAMRVELLVTLGSPLSMPRLVFGRLEVGAVLRPGQPTAGRGPGDKHRQRRRPGTRTCRCLQPSFDGVDTDVTDSIAMFDPHTANSYLARRCSTS